MNDHGLILTISAGSLVKYPVDVDIFKDTKGELYLKPSGFFDSGDLTFTRISNKKRPNLFPAARPVSATLDDNVLNLSHNIPVNKLNDVEPEFIGRVIYGGNQYYFVPQEEL